jgi:hypothetical protein
MNRPFELLGTSRGFELAVAFVAAVLGVTAYFTRWSAVEFFAVLASVAALTLIVSRHLK